jgi:polyisoprenoid-binding protein YceI
MKSLDSRDTKMSEDKNQKLEFDLKSDRFFNVEQYPEATFTITGSKKADGSIQVPSQSHSEFDEYDVSDPTHYITGNLKIRESEHIVTFPAIITINDDRIMADARFNIDRRDWNLRYLGDAEAVIENTVELAFKAQGNKN